MEILLKTLKRVIGQGAAQVNPLGENIPGFIEQNPFRKGADDRGKGQVCDRIGVCLFQTLRPDKALVPMALWQSGKPESLSGAERSFLGAISNFAAFAKVTTHPKTGGHGFRNGDAAKGAVNMSFDRF